VVRGVIGGKRVAIVGSGPGCLDNEPGFIDSHEVVVRINNYKLFSQTGRRVDVYYSYFGGAIKKTRYQLLDDGVKLCVAKCPNAQFMQSAWHRKNRKLNGIDFRMIYERRKGFWFCPTYVPTVEEFMSYFTLLGDHVPTTGFSALLDVLSCEPAEVFMTGFDFFDSGIHNVTERWRLQNVDDPIGHVPETERQWLAAHLSRYPITTDKRLTEALLR